MPANVALDSTPLFVFYIHICLTFSDTYKAQYIDNLAYTEILLQPYK